MKGRPAASWWTVPQAAVWIKTRDLERATLLDPEARRHLRAADQVVPGVHDASLSLRAALMAGRLEARALWRRSTEDQPIPPAFWQDGGRFSDEADGVAALGEHPRPDWTGIIVSAEGCQALWPAPDTA